MKKFLLVFMAAFCAGTSLVYAQNAALPNLSPLTKRYLLFKKEAGDNPALQEGLVYKNINGGLYLSGIIKVANAGPSNEKLNAMGVLVGTKAGNIWTVNVPVAQVAQFTQTLGIEYIQLDEPVYPKLNIARQMTRVDSVQKGINLPMAYSGKGVVVGVIDFGFDYTHPTFYDTLGTTYRIKKVWEMNGSGTPPTGYAYGNEIADTNQLKARGTDNAQQTHGSSTTAMAAGSGYGSAGNSMYRGMAYDASIVLVGVRRDSIGGEWMSSGFSDFIDGASYIFKYASSVGKPAVINISWGSQTGPHDGTSLINQAYDNLSGPGKLIVMSAGNEGQENIHLSKTFTATDSTINTFVSFTSYAANNALPVRKTWVDVWGTTAGTTFCGKATLYHNGVAGNSTGFICLDNAIHQSNLIGASGHDTCYVQFITSTSDFNGKPHLLFNIDSRTGDSVGISVKATSGSINMWDEYYYYGFTYQYQSDFTAFGQPSAVIGNSTSTTSDMGAAQSVLLVGAYTSNVTWTDLNNTPWNYSNYAAVKGLAPFSSRGPMIDGRVKPDITAPGLFVATACNSFDTANVPAGSNGYLLVEKYVSPVNNRTYYYQEFDGTSASSPAAAGITALLLQAKNDLTPQLLKSVLAATAIKDPNTGVLATPSNNWGNGKINAYGAIKKLLQDYGTGVYTFNGQKLDCVLYPNPGTGHFTIDYTGSKNDNLILEVTDITGKNVASQSWQVTEGLNRRGLDLSNLSKGIYLVKVAGANGSVSIKTVVQ